MTPCPRCGWEFHDPTDARPCERYDGTGHPSAARVAGNLVAKYGHARAEALVARLVALEPHARIAPDYGVSRERVRQWALALGTEEVGWTAHEDVARLAGGVRA